MDQCWKSEFLCNLSLIPILLTKNSFTLGLVFSQGITMFHSELKPVTTGSAHTDSS